MTAFYTDAGTRRKINQDSFLCDLASMGQDNILFAAVCDGVGGLSMGETASGSLAGWLSEWFASGFPGLSAKGFSEKLLRTELEGVFRTAHQRIAAYGAVRGVELGTTCAAFLAFRERYYIANIGDSRVSLVSDVLIRLTKDHTARGCRSGPDEENGAAGIRAPSRSVLTRCIGAGDNARPDFFTGRLVPGQTFLLCTDGFMHKLKPAEICSSLKAFPGADRAVLTDRLRMLTGQCRARGEQDNITSLVVRCL